MFQHGPSLYRILSETRIIRDLVVRRWLRLACSCLEHEVDIVVVLDRHRMDLMHYVLQALLEALHLLYQLAKDACSVELTIEEFEILLEEVMIVDSRTVALLRFLEVGNSKSLEADVVLAQEVSILLFESVHIDRLPY